MTKKRMAMRCRLEKTKNTTIAAILEIDNPTAWKEKTEEIANTLNIPKAADSRNIKNRQMNIIIKEALNKDLNHRMYSTRHTKSKINHLLTGRENPIVGERPLYMDKLNRYDVSTIFKARTRMIDVKNNYRGKYQDNICRGCGTTEETQQHVLGECTEIHKDQSTKILINEIFSEDTTKLKIIAEKIRRTEKILSESGTQTNVRVTR